MVLSAQAVRAICIMWIQTFEIFLFCFYYFLSLVLAPILRLGASGDLMSCLSLSFLMFCNLLAFGNWKIILGLSCILAFEASIGPCHSALALLDRLWLVFTSGGECLSIGTYNCSLPFPAVKYLRASLLTNPLLPTTIHPRELQFLP